MGLYVDLTPEQKAITRETTNQLRALHRSMAQVVVQSKVIQHAVDAEGGLRDIVTSLDAGEEVPNESGLSGAHSLSKAELAQLVALLDGFVTTYDVDATRQLWAKSSGVLAGL